jgi:hypothetical protein
LSPRGWERSPASRGTHPLRRAQQGQSCVRRVEGGDVRCEEMGTLAHGTRDQDPTRRIHAQERILAQVPAQARAESHALIEGAASMAIPHARTREQTEPQTQRQEHSPTRENNNPSTHAGFFQRTPESLQPQLQSQSQKSHAHTQTKHAVID